MFGVHPEEGSSAPDLVGDGHGFFHGAVGRAAVVLTGLYYPQANRIGWQLAGMLGCKNIFTRNNLYWFIVAFSTISEPCLTRCRILLASNDIYKKIFEFY